MTIWNRASHRQHSYREYKPSNPVGPVLKDCVNLAGLTVNGGAPISYNAYQLAKTADTKCKCGYTICSKKGPCETGPIFRVQREPDMPTGTGYARVRPEQQYPETNSPAMVPTEYSHRDAERDAPNIYRVVLGSVPSNHFFRAIPEMLVVRLIARKLIESKGKTPHWGKGELELMLPENHPARLRYERDNFPHCACGEVAVKGSNKCNVCASGMDYVAQLNAQAQTSALLDAQNRAMAENRLMAQARAQANANAQAATQNGLLNQMYGQFNTSLGRWR